MNFKKGFTLIELLVVVGIIAILASVVLALLGGARSKGSDGAIKSNLANGLKQAEVFYNTNTSNPTSYTNVCSTTTPQGGATTLYPTVIAAARAAGLSSYGLNNSPAAQWNRATCNN